jgi:hypothetical protein
MPIKVQCACGKAFAAKDELAGKTVKCPNCQQPLKIPGGQPQAAKAPAAAAAKPASAKPAAAAAKPAAAKPAAAQPAAKAAAAKPAAPAPRPAAPSGDSLFDEIGLQKAEANTRPCPGCTQAMPIEAVICIKCGYNTKLGRRMETVKAGTGGGEGGHGAVAADLLAKAAEVMDEDAAEERKKTTEGVPWFVWLIVLCLVIGFGVMMSMLPLKKALFTAGMGLAVIAQLVNLYAAIRLWIIAFSESVVQGLLCLFVPFYMLYYIATRWDRCSSYFMMILACIAVGFIAGLIIGISNSMENNPNPQSFNAFRGILVARSDEAWQVDLLPRGRS